MQQELFGTPANKSSKNNDLTIAKKGKQTLSKQQKDFNRLVKKIERLRSEIPITTAALNENLAFYSKHLHPLELEVAKYRVNGVKIFYPYFTGEKKFLTKKEKETLGEIIATALDEVLYLLPDEPDEELKTIFEAVNGESFAEAKKDAFDEMMFDMEDEFRAAGFDIDLSDMNENMSEEEIARKMKEKQVEFERMAEEQNAKKANRKKTRKQLEQDERQKQVEEARKKSISTIYKQLVKAFHPDLEKDEEIKLQKEAIMKQLTVAYENNDLHTLLKLEIEWISKEHNDPTKLTNDKLDIYNEVLKEQVTELEMELATITSHPRYAPLQRFMPPVFASRSSTPLNIIVLVQEKASLRETIKTLEQEEQELKGNNAVKFIKKIIHSFAKKITANDDLDRLLEQFLRGKI